MANFCTKCGNPLYLCTCKERNQSQPQQPQQQYQPQQPQQQYQPQQQFQPQPQQYPKQPKQKRAGSFCTKCGKPIEECECNKRTDSDLKVSLKNYLGLHESDALKKEDCFEIGKQIVPDLIEPCEEEVPIKQYDVGRVRRRLDFSWGYSRIQVTNKRIIQRTVGRSIIGKDMQYQEFAIDDIAGLSFNKGKQFALGDFFLWLILSAIVGAIGAGLGALFEGSEAGIVIGAIFAVLAIGCWAYIRFGQRKSSNVLFAFLFAFPVGMAITTNIEFIAWWDSYAVIPAILSWICAIFYLVYLVRSSLLPSISLLVKTRVYASEGASVSAGLRITKFKISAIILPGSDTENALREIGAIITDVQKLGDYAIDKWKAKTDK